MGIIESDAVLKALTDFEVKMTQEFAGLKSDVHAIKREYVSAQSLELAMLKAVSSLSEKIEHAYLRKTDFDTEFEKAYEKKKNSTVNNFNAKSQLIINIIMIISAIGGSALVSFLLKAGGRG